jgi:hypothetical protein
LLKLDRDRRAIGFGSGKGVSNQIDQGGKKKKTKGALCLLTGDAGGRQENGIPARVEGRARRCSVDVAGSLATPIRGEKRRRRRKGKFIIIPLVAAAGVRAVPPCGKNARKQAAAQHATVQVGTMHGRVPSAQKFGCAGSKMHGR